MGKKINYSKIEIKCKSALLEAGRISIKLKKNLSVKYKSENQPVTNADLEINNFLKEFLKKITPNYGWLSEESIDDKSRLDCENFWCLDPIDGTRSYIYNKPEYTISLALIKKKLQFWDLFIIHVQKNFFFPKKIMDLFATKKKLTLIIKEN